MKKITAVTRPGRRPYQEDRYTYMAVRGKGVSGALLAVMDGHGGESVAEFCSKEIKNKFYFNGNAEHSLRSLVEELNEATKSDRAGSTLSVALVVKKAGALAVSVAVLGDSPVIIMDKDGLFIVSPDHNVRTNMTERLAAEDRGGVYEDGWIFRGDYGLQISRSLGAAHFGGIISHESDIYTVRNPKWVLVASDGVFDPKHNSALEVLPDDLKSLAALDATANTVMKWAERRGLSDNTTALVWRAG